MLGMEIPRKARRFFITDSDGVVRVIIGDKTTEIVSEFWLETYSHEWFLLSRCFELSGIELETQDYYSTVVLATVLNSFNIDYNLKRDGTAHAEFTLELREFLKISGLIEKLNIRLVSSHLHSSSPLIYWLLREYAEKYKFIHSFLTSPEVKRIFGRGFNSYAEDLICYWKYNRYGFITYPRMTSEDDKIFIELSSHSDRPTVEFRLPRLNTTVTVKRFLLFVLLWYIFETRLPKQFLRQPLLKAIETVNNIDSKTLRRIKLETLLQKVRQFENECLKQYKFFFKIGEQEIEPVFYRGNG